MVHAANILSTDEHSSTYGNSDGGTFPIHPGYFSRAQSAGEERNLHLYFSALGPNFSGEVNSGKDGFIRICLNPHCPHTCPLDVEVREIDGIVLLRPGDDLAKGLRVDDLPPSKGRLTHLAIAGAAINTGDA